VTLVGARPSRRCSKPPIACATCRASRPSKHRGGDASDSGEGFVHAGNVAGMFMKGFAGIRGVETKKAGVGDLPKAVSHAGLRCDGPPGFPDCPSTRLPSILVVLADLQAFF
jgi:hypothetical protein